MQQPPSRASDQTAAGLSAAIAKGMQSRGWGERRAQPFVPDPELEVAGERLDRLREENPSQYEQPGLAQLKSRVFTYRNRKRLAEQQTESA